MHKYIFFILCILWNRVPIFAMSVWNRVANFDPTYNNETWNQILQKLSSKGHLYCIQATTCKITKIVGHSSNLPWAQKFAKRIHVTSGNSYVPMDTVPFCYLFIYFYSVLNMVMEFARRNISTTEVRMIWK